MEIQGVLLFRSWDHSDRSGALCFFEIHFIERIFKAVVGYFLVCSNSKQVKNENVIISTINSNWVRSFYYRLFCVWSRNCKTPDIPVYTLFSLKTIGQPTWAHHFGARMPSNRYFLPETLRCLLVNKIWLKFVYQL